MPHFGPALPFQRLVGRLYSMDCQRLLGDTTRKRTGHCNAQHRNRLPQALPVLWRVVVDEEVVMNLPPLHDHGGLLGFTLVQCWGLQLWEMTPARFEATAMVLVSLVKRTTTFFNKTTRAGNISD